MRAASPLDQDELISTWAGIDKGTGACVPYYQYVLRTNSPNQPPQSNARSASFYVGLFHPQLYAGLSRRFRFDPDRRWLPLKPPVSLHIHEGKDMTEKVAQRYGQRVGYTEAELERFHEGGHRIRHVSRLSLAAANYSIQASRERPTRWIDVTRRRPARYALPRGRVVILFR